MRLVLALVGLVAVAGFAHAEQPKRPLAVTVGPEGTPWADAAKEVAARADRLSGGVIRPIAAVGGTAGDELDTARRCGEPASRLYAWGGSAGALATLVPELDVFELPFLFQDAAEVDAAYAAARPLLAELLTRRGLVLYGAPTEVGWRNFGARRPLKGPADFNGLRVRSQENPIHLDMWRALGADPRPISVIETLGAMQDGIVEGFDQSPVFLFATSWYQSIKVYSLSRHIYQPGVVVLCRDALSRLPAAKHKKMLEGAEPIMAGVTKGVRALEGQVLDQLQREGVQVVALSQAERDLLRRRTRVVHETFRRRASPEARRLLEVIEAALERKRGTAASAPR